MNTGDREYAAQQIEEGAHLIPSHMIGAVRRYVLKGIPPGDFLTLLLSNDFMGAMGRADDANANAMKGWAMFLYNYVPAGCKGSPAAVSAWLRSFADVAIAA